MANPTLQELQNLKRRFLVAWSADTSSNPERWSKENPTFGQCKPAALIVQDLYGGKIYRGLVGEDSHFWNVLDNGTEIDLTREQFPLWTISNKEERSRDYILNTVNAHGVKTAEQYKELRRRLNLDS